MEQTEQINQETWKFEGSIWTFLEIVKWVLAIHQIALDREINADVDIGIIGDAVAVKAYAERRGITDDVVIDLLGQMAVDLNDMRNIIRTMQERGSASGYEDHA